MRLLFSRNSSSAIVASDLCELAFTAPSDGVSASLATDAAFAQESMEPGNPRYDAIHDCSVEVEKWSDRDWETTKSARYGGLHDKPWSSAAVKSGSTAAVHRFLARPPRP
jgi:hypothetical protein